MSFCRIKIVNMNLGMSLNVRHTTRCLYEPQKKWQWHWLHLWNINCDSTFTYRRTSSILSIQIVKCAKCIHTLCKIRVKNSFSVLICLLFVCLLCRSGGGWFIRSLERCLVLSPSLSPVECVKFNQRGTYLQTFRERDTSSVSSVHCKWWMQCMVDGGRLSMWEKGGGKE